MARFLMVAVLMTSLACGVLAKRHSLRVYEKGLLFKQTMDIDVKNRVIYIHVPGHRDIPECRYTYEYSTGRVLRCFPYIKRCYLSNFDTKSVPDPAEEEIDVRAFSRRHISPKIEARLEQKINHDTVVTGKLTDLSVISKVMRRALGHYALYREEPLPTGAKILKGSLNLGAGKGKRSDITKFQHVTPCPNNQDPVIRYARTIPWCNRMVFCSSESCREQHYMGMAYFRCGCCPHEWWPKHCRYGCRKIKKFIW